MPECVCVVGGQAATCRLRGDAWGAPLAELTSGATTRTPAPLLNRLLGGLSEGVMAVPPLFPPQFCSPFHSLEIAHK